MLRTIAAFVLAAGIAAAPASAVTYDAFSSFNGVQGAGNFYYGSVNDTITSGSLFGVNTNCFIAGSTCLQAAANFDVPGATKSTVTSFQYNSVNVPNDRLLVHPGPTAANGGVYVVFVAPISHYYSLTSSFSVQDTSPSGVGISLFLPGLSQLVFPLTVLDANNLTYSYSVAGFLNAGDAVGFVINRNGSYNNDSTGVNFTLTAVPEPATWALMIAGFGLVGLGLRRKAALTA